MSFARHIATAPAVAVLALCCGAAAAVAAPAHHAGPSTHTNPYLTPSARDVNVTSILTAADTVRGYKMAGTPDGMGTFDNGDGTFTVVMNHEFNTSEGTPRSHGNENGSFISRWVIKKSNLRVVSGQDQIRNLVTVSGTKNLNRLCSADMAPVSAFYDRTSGRGTRQRIFLNGEETTGGRAFGHVLTGGENHTSYELPALGTAAWENIAANPGTGADTVAVGQSDGTPSYVWAYHGKKTRSGRTVERAGLTNGVSLPIAVAGMPAEDGNTPYTGGRKRFTLDAAHATSFARPEDGAWDTRNHNVYYFATTASFSGHSRIWKLTFKNASKPELGGTIDMVLEGPSDTGADSTGPKMMDNLTVDSHGDLIIQEDPGNNAYLAGIFQLNPRTGELHRVARHDAALFAPGASGFVTQDEESSGVIPAPFLSKGAYLVADQIHQKVDDAAVVEMGQLDLMRIGTRRDDHGHHHR